MISGITGFLVCCLAIIGLAMMLYQVIVWLIRVFYRIDKGNMAFDKLAHNIREWESYQNAQGLAVDLLAQRVTALENKKRGSKC